MTRHIVTIVAITLATTIAALTGAYLVWPGWFGSDNTADAPSAVEHVSMDNPESVISAALTEIFTWHPGTDTSSADAYRRAGRFLVPALRNSGAPESEHAEATDGTQWARWQDMNADIVADVSITADEHPPDTDSSVSRVVLIEQQVLTSDGELDDAKELTAFVTAVRRGNTWLVSDIHF